MERLISLVSFGINQLERKMWGVLKQFNGWTVTKQNFVFQCATKTSKYTVQILQCRLFTF